MHTEPNIVIQPEIDIISLKMLNVLGCDTTNVTLKVRRKLFGCCDDESNKTFLTDSLSEIENEDVQRSSEIWNFDFRRESPLPAGRYAWEKVRNCDVPVWYTSLNSVIHNERLCVVPQLDSKERVDQSFQEMDTVEYKLTTTSNQENLSNTSRRRQNLVQTHIKGYAKIQKKRTLKRPCSKTNSIHFLRGPHRVANYILRNQDESTVS
ncbi:uncharacterized protein [Parasteatoda tepidariorum]|uniref:uncharacterized protein n=1 Tax=Parasteatoda tepidariorum TaxID=114398 RepID=UPI001C71EBA0|nr:uncharacterized protein LOC107456087 [Parasteatoda tepidariorum]